MNRLLHGDCMDVLPTLAAESVDAVITDPPYGMAFQSNWVADDRKKARIHGDERPFIWFLPQAFRILRTGGGLVCFTDWKNQDVWRTAIDCAGFTIRSHCVWDRVAHGMGDLKASFAPQHDVFWFATKGAFAFPGKRPKSVIRDTRVSCSATPHPTAKPEGLMRELCRSLCRPGDTVLDPFVGSGSTGVAAVKEGMNFVGVELDETYFTFAEQRLREAATDIFA